MSRCLQLAEIAMGDVAPNPMVGSVLVFENKIIAEGYHQKYGEAHAEVNCINNVSENDKNLIEKSTLYVSLEPCSHYGKTPPCADLIIRNKIKKVVIGCKDVYKEVAGKGIAKLENAGVEVVSKVLEKECIELNKRFFTFHQKFRPYIILKWAQSFNGKIAAHDGKRILISNEYSNRLVHKWRGEESSILIGTTTALKDNPFLTTRLWQGKNPVRIVIGKNSRLPTSLNVFNGDVKTIIFSLVKNTASENLFYIKLENEKFLEQLLHSLFEMNIQSLLVEGGAKTLQSFVDVGLWDEARVITNEKMVIENGIPSPEIKDFILEKQQTYFDDRVSFYKNKMVIL
jgi:diaminohydroxyphosphoribosylaminopyrimidine deaminase/5-amino-6-(5-phosphoribosylamino)uracil reductase